ncbi:hypothetical protein [Nocardioides sp. Kera G14]|uniref:hypothetical protein n=1 Tax=Nocardioides sp. Kera G14 TaxID=2884264 RepID=UPI001D0FC2C7|nr:hypothetical protein [Nocardioides sp. Kera G14]UDY23338.1 hypothetical protein LH076_14930 [Nocardioides sp. Kera G14]
MSDSAAEMTYYRLAPQVRVRFIGLYLVALAIVVFALTVVFVAADLTPDVMIVIAVLGLIGLGVLAWWLSSRAYVVRATPDAYEVRLVRGAGTRSARWAAVEDAVTTSPHGIDCVVLRLKDGTTTTIPVELLAVQKDEFVRQLQGFLQQGQLRR